MKKNALALTIGYFLLHSSCFCMSFPNPLPSNVFALKTLIQDRDKRCSLISGLTTYAEHTTLGSRRGEIARTEKENFDKKINDIIIHKISSSLGDPISLEAAIVPRDDVVILVGSIRHLVMTRASAYAMDGKQAKNTTLASLGAGVLTALQVAYGPLNPTGTAILPAGVDRRVALANFIRKTAGYIESTIRSHGDSTMDLSIPRVIKATESTFVEESSHTHPEVIAFCTKINTMLHPNDSGAFLRKGKRRYYQASENLHWILLWLLLEEYYNSGAPLPTITEHNTGVGIPSIPTVLENTVPLDGRAIEAIMLLLKGF